MSSRTARTSSTLFLTDRDIVGLADWPTAIASMRSAYSADLLPAQAPRRTTARAPGAWLRSLTATLSGSGVMGAKLIAAAPVGGTVGYLLALFDTSSGELVALMDANHITGTRTAATTAVALDHLTDTAPLSVGVIGSGFEARQHLSALMSVREVGHCRVFSPRPESRQSFSDHFAGQVAVTAVGDPAEAARGADVVICAARARGEQPTLHGSWLGADAVVASIGSTMPEQREVDVSVVDRAALIVADTVEEVTEETGDMLAAAEAGIDFLPRVVSLTDLVARGSRSRADGIALYKSVGSGLQDVALAASLLERARDRGVGTMLGQSIAIVEK